jgi:hypothetical protein
MTVTVMASSRPFASIAPALCCSLSHCVVDPSTVALQFKRDPPLLLTLTERVAVLPTASEPNCSAVGLSVSCAAGIVNGKLARWDPACSVACRLCSPAAKLRGTLTPASKAPEAFTAMVVPAAACGWKAPESTSAARPVPGPLVSGPCAVGLDPN